MLGISLFEWLLYICFSILSGSLFHHNKMAVPKKFVLSAAAGTALFSAAPLINQIAALSGDIGFGTAVKNVLIDFDMGRAWFILVVIAGLLFCLIAFNHLSNDPFLTKIALILVIILIGVYTYISLSSGIFLWLPFIFRFFYLLSLSCFGGLLLASRSQSPSAALSKIVCLIMAFISCALMALAGLWTAPFHQLIHQFKQSLMVNSGQAAVILNLLLLTSLWCTLICFIFKRADRTVNLILFLFILGATSFLNQQAAPLDISALIKAGQISPLFQAFYHKPAASETVIPFTWHAVSVGMITASCLCLFLIGISLIKKWPEWLSVVFSFLFIVSGYLTVMSMILSI
ncbi:putative copper resistance protein D [Scopulibacillus daqui]|uniref:Copper resistance protein D n=1 Tax=Scopulibacillus daqui TaxID=1469162 RepID=A0ABS2PV31_9BACL|nr:hypothetical protein [Scopulibacillus daqui]MBM7643919.1 putative copper resistance protein D [Scopulibacillus daqui]